MESRYDTSPIEAHRRFDYWIDVVCRHCIPAACDAPDDKVFNGSFYSRSIGVIDVSAVRASHHRWQRNAQHIRQGPDDDLWLSYIMGGKGVLTQDGRDAQLGAGDIVFYDAARPFAASIFEIQSAFWVRLPRRSLLQRCPKAEKLTARTIDINQPVTMPLRSMIESAVNIDFAKMRPGAAAQFGTTLLDLAATALEFQWGDSEGYATGDSDIYERVLTYIQRNLEDPDLNLEGISRTHGVSSRTITRAFARHGQTPMKVVWQKRVEASWLSIVEGRSNSVTGAAFDHGFSDLSHFSRSFRKTYGCAPHSLLSR